MPTKGYKQTKEHILNKTKAQTGLKRTEITKKKIGLGNKEKLKDKTYEEIHGIEKAKEINMKKSKAFKNKTYEQIMGEERAKELRMKRSKVLKDKSLEERIGPERMKYQTLIFSRVDIILSATGGVKC